MLGTPEMDAFVSAHQWGVLTTLRRNGEPSSSIVGYARDADELLIAASESTLKVRCLEGNPRVALCIFGDEVQPRFVTVEGRARIQRDALEEPKRRILAHTVPPGYPPSAIESWLYGADCVVLRIRASRVSGRVDRAAAPSGGNAG